jgi:hypothetical protein
MPVHSVIFDDTLRRTEEEMQDGRISRVTLTDALKSLGAESDYVPLQNQCSRFRQTCRSLAINDTPNATDARTDETAAIQELGRQRANLSTTVSSLLNNRELASQKTWDALEKIVKGIDSLYEVTCNSIKADPSWVKDKALLALRKIIMLDVGHNFNDTEAVKFSCIEFNRHARGLNGPLVTLVSSTSPRNLDSRDLEGSDAIQFLEASRDRFFKDFADLAGKTCRGTRNSTNIAFTRAHNHARTAADIAVESATLQYKGLLPYTVENNVEQPVVYADASTRLRALFIGRVGETESRD